MSVRELFESMDYGQAPESPDLAENWLDKRRRRFGHFINGEFYRPATEKTFDTENPATQKVLANCALGTAGDVAAAVASAREAQPKWATLSGTVRARYLYALARQIQKHQRLFAILEAMDNGKTIRESRDIDVPLAIRHFYYHAGWAANQVEELGEFEPLGVCGQIIPWNFPLLMLAWKIAPAIALGNCVVLKPAEQTPLTALAFAGICRDIALPPGVVNIVTGNGATGFALVSHPDINKIAFTGSTEVGRLIRKATAGTGKRLTLELGGKSPFIVFDDADLDSAVEGVVDSIWFNQGQVCCAGSRLLVQEGIAERFLGKLRQKLEKLRIGDPLDKCVDMGPLISQDQLKRVSNLVSRAADDGARIFKTPRVPSNGGYFFPPTLVCDVEPSYEIAQEEVFGPVLVSMTFRTPDEAILLANHSRYGLAGSVWSENINLALHIAASVKAGVLWVNSANQLDAAAEFGGIKESGFGREGGKEGLLAYLRQKNVKTVRPDPERRAKTKPASALVDRTAKMYIGGKQTRSDRGYSYPVHSPGGKLMGLAGLGNRKDVRNAVEAARSSSAWRNMHGHSRAQVLFYLAENLAARKAEFATRISSQTGKSGEDEVLSSIDILFRYAGWADKFDGAVRDVNAPGVVLKMNEPVGVIGVVCRDEHPLEGFIELVAPVMAMGNSVVAVPSQTSPLAATDVYQLLDTSDVPAGVLNIVTGFVEDLVPTLAAHNDVDALWCARPELMESVEKLSVGNLKRTWIPPASPNPKEALREATESKSVWIPYGE